VAESFRDRCAGITVGFKWLGITRRVKGQFRERFLEETEADASGVEIDSKILNPKNEHLCRLTSIKSQAVTYYRDNTLPYVEKGKRLCRKDRYLEIRDRLLAYRDEIKQAEAEMEANRDAVLEDARQFRKKLFNASEYPATFLGCFDISVEPVNLDPPSYLMELNPEEYERARKSLEEKCEKARLLYEEQLAQQGLGLVEKLLDRMRPAEDGRRKVFSSSLFDELTTFFTKYKELKATVAGIRSETDVDKLVEQAEQALANFDVDGIRSSQKVRDQVTAAFSTIADELEKTVAPARRVVHVDPVPEEAAA